MKKLTEREKEKHSILSNVKDSTKSQEWLLAKVQATRDEESKAYDSSKAKASKAQEWGQSRKRSQRKGRIRD